MSCRGLRSLCVGEVVLEDLQLLTCWGHASVGMGAALCLGQPVGGQVASRGGGVEVCLGRYRGVGGVGVVGVVYRRVVDGRVQCPSSRLEFCLGPDDG